MAGTVNKAIVVGFLGKDPDIIEGRYGKIASFSLATTERWRDKATGERKEKTDWHRVVVYNDKLAEVAQKFLKKGSLVYVEGIMRTRVYEDKRDGIERYTTEVVLNMFGATLTMLDRKEGGARPPDATEDDYIGPEPTRNPDFGARAAKKEDFDDEIPF